MVPTYKKESFAVLCSGASFADSMSADLVPFCYSILFFIYGQSTKVHSAVNILLYKQ
jgi:hypothetical protein